ncbi:DUF4397 domain-containing protein [Corallococcus sp. Z5C101001]|uniref:DUF4397 domain-containing protein n=1 Tax=Corallococcus sp. Z5C101001 TaxID=2596829 RepID=UPI00117F0EC0|nr:DUF4397 domain-containing protein [Corallococcus sp. Z5C101001]TSC27709.1 DUF4397 domain-containing protein [Corallococcus sp. Z5C101001]
MKNRLRAFLLWAGLGLLPVLAGCDAEECKDAFDCRDQGTAPAGQAWTCQESLCVAVTLVPAKDAGTNADAGVDGGPGVDAGADGGVDAGVDGGVDAGADAGPVAYVRFVNSLYEGNFDDANTPWDAARYRMEVHSSAASQPLFTGVEPGAAGAKAFIAVTPGAKLTFTLRRTGAAPSQPAVATSAEVSLAEGGRLTLLAMGGVASQGTSEVNAPKLLVLDDSAFGAVPPGEVRVRHVTADQVIADFFPRFLKTDSGDELPEVTPFTADPEVKGRVIPEATTRLLVRGSIDTPEPSQSGELGYTLPAGALVKGQAYYVLSSGDDRRAMNDPGASTLWLIPVGKDGAVRMKRDPLLYFFHALDSGAPLKALSQGVPVAADFRYGSDPKPGDLPASAAGHTLSFVLQSDGATSVLGGVQTGPLEAGRRYLVVVSGQAGGTGALAPRAFVVPDTFPSEAQDARVRFVNACAASPATGASLGYFDVALDGSSRGTTFTPVIQDVAYGTAGGATDGVAFPAPTGTDVTGSYFYYAVRGTVSGAPTNRSVQGLPIVRPHLFLLMGNWDSGPTFRAFNLRSNTWSVLTPRGDDVFRP